MQFVIICICAFFSGAAALASETIWNRIFTNAFGATNFATTLVLAVFFSGLCLGSSIIRRWRYIVQQPWHAFSVLEGAIALLLLPTFFLSRYDVYPAAGVSSVPLRYFLQSCWVILLVGLPSFVMGGTLPALAEASKEKKHALGFSFIYGTNTIGGAVGIYFATFIAIYSVGAQNSLVICMIARLVIAGIFWVAAKYFQRRQSPLTASARIHTRAKNTALPLWMIIVSFVSGATLLGFEALLLHAYALVGQNSSWSFGAMLMLVIIALGISACIAPFGNYNRLAALKVVVPAVSLLCIVFPEQFFFITDGLQNISLASGSITAYIFNLIRIGGLSAGPLLLLAGLIFPWIMNEALATRQGASGRCLGKLLAVNALGAIVSVISIEWVCIPLLGLWKSCRLLATLYLVVWILLQGIAPAARRARIGVAFCQALGFIVFTVSLSWNVPHVSTWEDETVLSVQSGPEGIVSVSRKADGLYRMSIDNSFILSTSASSVVNRRMGHIPLLLHPAPADVAFIGLATGLTASSAVMHTRPESITILELSPRVISLSLEYFAVFNGQFHKDERVRIVEADGVHYFATTPRQYDVIVGDLFFPWRKGIHRLYTQEHFRHIREHLRAGGVFCQWLPPHQLDTPSLAIIVRTFTSVFTNSALVQVWGSGKRYIALIGRNNAIVLGGAEDRATWFTRLRTENINDALFSDERFIEALFLEGIGRLRAQAHQIHTMDRPVLEPFAIRFEPTYYSSDN